MKIDKQANNVYSRNNTLLMIHGNSRDLFKFEY